MKIEENEMQNKSLNKSEKQEGITLIALVVTIIVLLILAGVTISLVVGQNGIITRANEAKEVTRGASVEEQVLIWKLDKETARLQGESYVAETEEIAIIDRLAGQKLLTDEEVAKLKDTATNPNREITIGGKDISFKLEESSGGNTPVPTPEVPAYKEELTHKEGTIEEGYVVTDKDNNEYVWIPVENPVAETEAEITTMIAEGKYPMAVKIAGTDSKGRQNYRGVLYDYALDTIVTPNIVKITPKSYSADGYREPAYLTETTYGDASSNNTVGITVASLQEEYNEMVERVISNKGFYIGRYEASYNSASSKAESKPNTVPMTAADNSQRWYGMYAKQKGTVGNAITHMIWGSQYDQVMIFMKDVPNEGKSKPFYILDSTNMGNYIDTAVYDSEGKNILKPSGTNSELNTGVTTFTKVKNIYDLAGNVWEWTMEAYSSENRTGRGGGYSYYGSSGPARSRSYSSPTGTDSSGGSRSTLY